MSDININSLRENTFFATLLIYVLSLPHSEAFVSISAGILIAQAIILRSWKHPSFKQKNYKTWLMVSSVFVVYLVGMFITEDFQFALYEIRKVLFWLVLPLAFFISPILSSKRFKTVLVVFCAAVFSASLIAMVRLVFKDYFQINEFRDITLISHIRFSFQVVLLIVIVAYSLLSGIKILPSKKSKTIAYLLLSWMIVFLFIIKSITGILAFLGTAFFVLLLILFKQKTKKIVVGVLLIMVVLIATPVFYVSNVWNDFYNIEKLDPLKVDKTTLSGNPYYFDFSSYEKENRQWVRVYICETELREEWNKKSEMKFDSVDANGYLYSSTLIRYLTSKGLRKDSAGVNQLTPIDVEAVEKGIANHIYVNRGFSIYPRIYETIWEIDRYKNVGDPNYQSLSQRFEFIKASLLLIKKNPLFGIGTGNWKIKYAEAYTEMDSKLLKKNQGPSHNQYLNYLVKFGVVGFVYIFTMLILPVFKEKHNYNLLFWMFLISISIANFADANFESHMGLSFFCFFYCLFLWQTPQKIKTFRL